MFWLIGQVTLFFVVIIAYYLLAGMSATTRDMELIHSMNLQLEYLIDNSIAFNPVLWKVGEFGPTLLTWMLPVLRDDVQLISKKMWAPLGLLYRGVFHCFYGLMRAKVAVAGSPRDVRALLGLQIWAVRRA